MEEIYQKFRYQIKLTGGYSRNRPKGNVLSPTLHSDKLFVTIIVSVLCSHQYERLLGDILLAVFCTGLSYKQTVEPTRSAHCFKREGNS